MIDHGLLGADIAMDLGELGVRPGFTAADVANAYNDSGRTVRLFGAAARLAASDVTHARAQWEGEQADIPPESAVLAVWVT